MSTREPPSSSNGDETSTEAPSLLPRRDFLGVAAGAVLSLSGCVDGDDAAPAMTDGTDGTGGTGGTDDSTGEPMPEPPDAGEPGVPFDPAAIPESVELFPRTPMAGEMKPASFMIAGYVETGEDVTVRVWQPGAVEGEVHLRLDVLVTPDANGFLKVEVDGLQGGEWYDYGLFAGDADAGFSARSLLGRARTALPDGVAEPVRIAIAACIGRGLILPEYIDPDDPRPAAPWDTMQRAAEHDYDIFIHLGDQGYFDDVYAAGGSYEQYLAAWGVLQHFSVFVFSDEVGAAKPSAEVFRRACEGFGVAPEEAAHVGDREINDVLGPQRFGMKGFLYTGVKDRRDGPSAADLIYDDHAALLGLLDGLR